MRKIFLVVVAACSFFPSISFAKPEGSHIELDFIGTRTKFYSRSTYSDSYLESIPGYDGPRVFETRPSSSNNEPGLGLNYEYAFSPNCNKFFIAPGFIIEQHSVGSGATQYTVSNVPLRLQTKSRLGVKADFGYALTQTISPYVTIGYAMVNYKTRSGSLDNNNNAVSAVSNGRAYSPFFGIGIATKITNKIFLNLEYNYQKFDANAKIPPQSQDYLAKQIFVSRLDVLKLGVSYSF